MTPPQPSAQGDSPRRDRVLVRGLLVRAVIGVDPWEREHPQDVCVDLELFTDTRRAAADDALHEAIDYRALCASVTDYAERAAPRLVETLAEGIARLCVLEHGAYGVRVRVEKPTALPDARSVGVAIERDAADFA